MISGESVAVALGRRVSISWYSVVGERVSRLVIQQLVEWWLVFGWSEEK